MLYFLRFRCLQAWRAIRDVGWGNLVVILPLLIVLSLAILQAIDTYQHPLSVGLWGLTLLGFHRYRKDVDFLRKLGFFLPLLFAVEYALLSLPMLIALLALGQFVNALYLIPTLALLSVIPPSPPAISLPQFPVPQRFPDYLFEWKTALRRQLPFLVFLYALGLLAAYWTAVPIVVAFLLSLAAASAYEWLEDKELIEVQSGSDFLRRKVSRALLVFHIALLPLGVSYLVFNYPYWYLWLIVLFANSLVLCFAICYKYAVYQPRRRRAFAGFPITIFACLSLVPFFLPVGIGFCWMYWRKAEWNLLQYT